MIVSHKYRFIFLKTRKTAGTSIEVALSKIAGGDAIVTPVHPPEAGHEPRNYGAPPRADGHPPLNLRQLARRAEVNPECCSEVPYMSHMRSCLVRAKLGREVWDSYFKFCFERNPWEKVASIYGWRTRNLESPVPFHEWLFSAPRVTSDWPIYSVDDECVVDAVGRYERLNQDLEVFLERAGVPSRELDLPSAKSGFRRRVWYPPNCVSHIERVFHREIDLFGYVCPPELLAS